MPSEPTDAGAPQLPPEPASLWIRLLHWLRTVLASVDAWFVRRIGVAGSPLAPAGKSSNALAEDRTLLAIGRTMMAADRSLMAWIRTSLSLLSFGFTIYKLLQSFAESGHLEAGRSPRSIGLFLTAMGTAATAAGIVDYWHTFKQLRQYHPIRIWRPSFVFALVMAGVGVFLFFAIILKAF